MIENMLLFPFRLAWNIIVLAIVIGRFFLWWPFLFGSERGVILVLLFAPVLFFWPVELCAMMVPLWPTTIDER